MPIRFTLHCARALSTAAMLVFLAVAPSLAQQPAAPAPAAEPTALSRLDSIRLQLDQLETSIRRDDVTEAALGAVRGNAGALHEQLQQSILSLEARVGDTETRLKQLGAPPAAGAPPENETISRERSQLSARQSDLDAALKQARLLLVRVGGLNDHITERRRTLFTRQIFMRASSAFDPAFWQSAAMAVPDETRGTVLLVRSWVSYALDNGGVSGMLGALVTLIAFAAVAIILVRWARRRTWHTFSPGTRFLKSLYALTALVRLTATIPAIAIAIVLVLDAFALLPPRIMEIGLGLVAAIAVASFGRGVAVALFAPSEPERRLPQLADIVAPLYAGHLTWAARILGAGIFFNVMQKALVAPLSLTVATSAVLAILIAILLGHLSWRIARCEAIPDDAPGGQWAGGAGWMIAAAVVVALATGYVGFAAFLATRLIAAVAAIGTLYILLVFVDSLFGETLTANSRYGRAVGHFFGIKPRSVELIGTLLSAALRILLILVAAFPMLGPWGIFASDFFSVLRDAVFGFRVGDVTISLVAILTAFAIVFVGVLLTRGMQSWLTSRFLPRTTLDPGLQHSVSTILGYVAMFAVLAVALAALGIDLQKITLVAGALSIGIGFGLQSVVSNFVSGLILLAERPIRVGDIINVKGEEGAVRRIHVRATEIETADRASVIIPNSELITGVVKNWTHANTLSRIIIKVGVDYDSDVEKVREILLAVAHEHPVVVQTPAPVVLLTGFGDSAINFELSGVVRNIAEAAIVKSDLYFEILKRFRAAGIEIPYPQQVTWQGDIQPPVRSRRPRKRT